MIPYYLPIIIITPVEITSTNVTKNKIMLRIEITDERLSRVSVMVLIPSIEEIIEQICKEKYHIKSSAITGRLISIITIITNTPKVFFIITKLLKTDDNASPTPAPTTGTNAPEMNFIPLSTILSEELASML